MLETLASSFVESTYIDISNYYADILNANILFYRKVKLKSSGGKPFSEIEVSKIYMRAISSPDYSIVAIQHF